MTPTQKKNARDVATSWLAGSVRNAINWHYSQFRPFSLIDRSGTGRHVGDCSSHVINVFWNISHDLRVFIDDPSGMKFSGYGNTWSLESWLRKHGKRVTETNGYLVADIALYDGHTVICSTAGTGLTSQWTSHGSERDPRVVKLHYRDDLVGVWRHPALL